MKKNCLLSSLLVLALCGCGGGNDNPSTSTTVVDPSSRPSESTSTNTSSSWSEPEISQEDDVVKMIPQEVLNYEGSIDILIYIEGQDNTMVDIGSSRYTTQDLFDTDIAKYAAAAREFRKIAPKVKFNVIYCNINDFDERIQQYNDQNGHLPHIIHPTKQFYEMMENGLVADLSRYSDSEYFQSLNPSFMEKLTFGNFVAAFPTHYAPYGMFVNKNILKKDSIVDPTNQIAYEEWVDNLTYEEFVNVCKETYHPYENAGLSHVTEMAQSLSYPSIYKQYCETGEIEFNNEDVKKMLELESELADYSTFDYSVSANTTKDEFTDVKFWNVNDSFVNGYFTFDMEAPWNIGVISQIAENAGKGHNDFDFMPYPKADENTDNYVGIGIGGLVIGDQCPISNGEKKCRSATSQLEMDVAAYFTMFMITDPRAIKAEAEIEFKINDNTGATSKGVVPLPLIDKNFRFSWQDDPEVVASIGGDPSEGFDNNWEYQMSLYLKTYKTWWDDSTNPEPDVKYFTNVNYGLSKIIDIVYEQPENVIDYRSLPLTINPGGSEVINIMEDWSDRYEDYVLTSETYVADLIAKLPEMQEKVNSNTRTAYEFFQECLDDFYGVGKYNVMEKFQ